MSMVLADDFCDAWGEKQMGLLGVLSAGGADEGH